MRQAVALDPHSVAGHMSLGHLLSQMGRHLEAEREMRRARELDPLFAMSHALSSQVAYQARDYSSAVEYAHQAITIDPDFWVGHIMLGQAYEGQGRTAEALAELATAGRFSGQNSKALSFRGYLLAKAGRADDVRALPRILEDASQTRYVPPYALALVQPPGRSRRSVSMADRRLPCTTSISFPDCGSQMGSVSRLIRRFKAQLDRCNFMHVAPQ